MIPSGALASTKKLVDFASFGIGDFGPDVSSLWGFSVTRFDNNGA